MLVCQNDIGSPKILTSTPARRRCAAAASPYGPAPMMATLVSVTVLPPAARRPGREPVCGRSPRSRNSRARRLLDSRMTSMKREPRTCSSRSRFGMTQCPPM